MTDKAKAKIEELMAQKIVVEILDDFIDQIESRKKYAVTNSEIIYEKDEDGNYIEDENGRKKYHWEERPYTEEEIEADSDIKAKLNAYDTLLKALEKMM